MSHIRQNYDNGHDIVSAIENGEAYDFSKEMPKITTPTAPTAKEVEDKPDLQRRRAHQARAGQVASRGGKRGLSNKPIFPQPLCLSL